MTTYIGAFSVEGLAVYLTAAIVIVLMLLIALCVLVALFSSKKERRDDARHLVKLLLRPFKKHR